MTEKIPVTCHFPGHVSDNANKTSFSAGLGLYKMVDATPFTGDGDEVTVMYNFENPRTDPQTVLFASEPSIPLLPPHKAYLPDYTLSYEDIFRKKAHLQVMPQFMNLVETYPSLVFGPITDRELMKDWKPLRKHKDLVDTLEDALFLGCPRDLLLNELHAELDYRGIEKHTNHLHHGGCLCFIPASEDTSSKVAGFLVYPSGAAMDILTVTTLSPHLEESSSRVRLTPKPENEIQRMRLSGAIRQIEAIVPKNSRKHYFIVRTDYQAHVINVKLSEDGNDTLLALTKTINSQHRMTSVTLSPFIQQEYVCSLDSGEVILAESGNGLLRSEVFSSNDRKHNPIFSHFGAHPREIFIHDQREAFLYDFRCPVRTRRCLFQLPHKCLSSDQRFFVAKQHPTDDFYNYIATQDALLLLDQRFPEHPVIESYHNVQGVPSYLEVSRYEDCHPWDIVMVGNHNEKQIHCLFVDSSHEPPGLSSSVWKISPYHDWVEMLGLSHPPATKKTWERLDEPLLGFAAAQVSIGYETSWNVMQISAAGDLFLQTFKAPTGEVDPRRSIASEDSLRLCDLWMESVNTGHPVGPENPAQRCRKRPYLEYHRACDRCRAMECLLGSRPIHGLPRAMENMRKSKKVDADFVAERGKELHSLWQPSVCHACAELCVKDVSMFGDIRVKKRGFVRSLGLPWETDLEQSKVTFGDLPDKERDGGSSPNTAEQDVERPGSSSRIEISAEDGRSSLVVPFGECEVPLSQTSFNVTLPEQSDSPSFHMILNNKKRRSAAKKRRSNEPQEIGF